MNNLLLNSLDVAKRLEKKTCVLIFSWQRHLPFLKICLEQIRKLNFFTVLAYDKGKLPTEKILNLVDLFVVKHYSSSGVVKSWMWHTKYTLPIIEEFNFKYVFSISGDCLLETPENFSKLFDLLGKKDILTYWYDHNRIGTMAWLCKMESYRKIVDYIYENWDEKISGGMVEARVKHAVDKIGATKVESMKEYFNFVMPPDGDPTDKRGRGLFGDILGMRHLYYEDLQRKRQNMLPLEKGLIECQIK